MIALFESLFANGAKWSRKELSLIFAAPDRSIRNMIREARRQGMPIMALPDGGYKLAETQEEKQKLLHMYRGRAMDELKTYSELRKTLQLDGQISLEEMLGAVMAEARDNDSY